MSNVSYKVRLRIAREHAENAREEIERLFSEWQAEQDTEEMTLSWLPASREFTFDTVGEVDVSPALMDDTMLSLRTLGEMAEAGAVVRHAYYGRPSDFVVGPNPEEREAAARRMRLEKAAAGLAEVRDLIPGTLLPRVDELIGEIGRLAR